jgi:adenylate cyclase
LVERELQITRGFGYHHLLPFINVNPCIRVIDIGPHEEFVIIASQSFWQYVRYQVAIDIARAYRDHPEVAAQRLRDTALAYGAAVGMTVLFIDLKNFGAVQAAVSAEIGHEQLIERRRRVLRGSVEDRTLSRLAAEISPPMPPCAIVFTDIRESTKLWEKDPNAMRAANKIHNQIMRRLLRHHRGYEVKNEGDAFMVVFETVLDALKWCKNVQQQLIEAEWPQEILNSAICAPVYDNEGNILYSGLSVRMGIHYGMAINEQDIVTRRMDYFGVEVITASRICDAALGGQIIVTAAVYNMAQETVATTGENLDLAFFEIGATKLKGIENFEVVYAVYPASLSGRFTQQEFAILPSEPPARL